MSRQKLIDKYLPAYSFNEYHEILINGPVDKAYEAARNIDLSKSKLIKWLFKLRGLPTKRMHLQDFVTDVGFSIIEENNPIEILIGFWATSAIQPITSPDDFINNTISARIKVGWNFYLDEINSNQIRLSTETRILCTTASAKVTFGLYWLIIRPFSGLIRNRMLQIAKQDTEYARLND